MLNELNQCTLPVKITNGSNLLTVTAYNTTAILYTDHKGNENYMAMHFLKDYYLVERETVIVYKYTYLDEIHNEKGQTPWTTESFDSYFKDCPYFIKVDTDTKAVKL